ncbi:pentatricopeptide repeat-containing protein, partial [Tanacetum coccineum]
NDLTLLGRWIVSKSTWLRERRQSDQTVVSMFLQMQSIGYKPDGDVSNYLISSLCKVDQYEEAVQMLKLRLDSARYLLAVKETGLQVAPATNNLQLLTITAQPNTFFAEPSNEIF